MTPARILIVEDEGILALALESMLKKSGYVPLEPVSTGEAAIVAVDEKQPDLVLMDIQLAGEMDGITTAGHIHTFSDIPIVYLTGHSDEVLLQRAKLTRPYGYLIKPVSVRELKACLEMTLHQHELSKKLQESEVRYRNIVENVNDALLIHDFKGRIIDVNDNACRMLGYERSELIDANLDLFSSSKALCFQDERIARLRKDPSIVFETRCSVRNGKQIPIEVSSKVVSRESSGIVQAFMRDISERKKYEEEIFNKNEQLQKAVAERDKFFSIIAHDLRSPFIGFLLFIRMMTEKINNLSPEEVQRLSREMRDSAENLYDLLENLLQWSLVQRGESEYEPSVCKLADIVRQNIELMYTLAVHKNITFKSDVPDDLKIWADKSMLETILRNLLSNAVKFSQPGGEISISASLQKDRVLVSVTDNGVGMAPELLSRLFMMDKISSRKGTAQEKGTGLGLLLCKEFVQKHKGEIWATSRPGNGTTFYFTLPAEMN